MLFQQNKIMDMGKLGTITTKSLLPTEQSFFLKSWNIRSGRKNSLFTTFINCTFIFIFNNIRYVQSNVSIVYRISNVYNLNNASKAKCTDIAFPQPELQSVWERMRLMEINRSILNIKKQLRYLRILTKISKNLSN